MQNSRSEPQIRSPLELIITITYCNEFWMTTEGRPVCVCELISFLLSLLLRIVRLNNTQINKKNVIDVLLTLACKLHRKNTREWPSGRESDDRMQSSGVFKLLEAVSPIFNVESLELNFPDPKYSQCFFFFKNVLAQTLRRTHDKLQLVLGGGVSNYKLLFIFEFEHIYCLTVQLTFA